MKSLNVSESRANDLLSLKSISLASLSQLNDELVACNGILSHAKLRSIFQKFVAESDAELLMNNLAAWSLLRDEGPYSSTEVIEALLQGCKNGGFSELDSIIFERKEILIQLISSKAIYIAIKSAKLFAIDSLHLHEFKIYCDSRPIFEPQRETIDAIILYGVLHIKASDDEENEEVFRVSIRRDDIDKLISECEKAKRKLDKMADIYSGLEGVATVQYGDE